MLALLNPKGRTFWRKEKQTLWGLCFPNEYKQSNPLDPQMLFAGQFYDEESGLAYNRFRYYDPNSGNYISSDPIGLSGGERPFGYITNPLRYIDAYGLYSDLLPTGIGHHLLPRSVAKKLGLTDFMNTSSISWYPNKAKGSSDLHKLLHRNLINSGIPYHGSKFTGNIDDFFDKAKQAYEGIDTKGFLKIPGENVKIMKNITPLEALDYLYKSIKETKLLSCRKGG